MYDYIYDVTTTVPLILYDNTIEIDYVTFSYGKSYATLATLIIIPFTHHIIFYVIDTTI